MDTARTFKRIISVDCINSAITNTSNTRFYLPTRNDIERYTIKAIAVSEVNETQANYYLTIVDINNDTLLSQFPLTDLYMNFLFYGQAGLLSKLRLFNLKNINMRASYLETVYGNITPFPLGVTLAKIQFYI